MSKSRVTKSLFFALLGLANACGSDSTDVQVGDPALTIAAGNGQSAVAGAALADPVTVRVTQGGAGVSGVSVAWSVASGGGAVNPAASTTGADGRASTTWTLGAAEGANTLQAAASGVTGSPVTLNATGTSGTPPATASVTVRDNFFDPSSVTVAVGGTVTWTWAGTVAHNVTLPGGGGTSATQASGTFSHTFASAGSVTYQCTIHAGMQATVVVQ